VDESSRDIITLARLPSCSRPATIVLSGMSPGISPGETKTTSGGPRSNCTFGLQASEEQYYQLLRV
jgi:hypothetical protein